MSLAGKAMRILFSFNGFLLLAFALFRLRLRLDAGEVTWLPYVLLGLGIASLLWVLYQESRLPAPESAPIAAHMVWLLSAGGYVWLTDDASLTFVGHVWPDFSAMTMQMMKEAYRVKLVQVSIYVLLSTTGLAWLVRVVARARPDPNAPRRRTGIDVLLIVSVMAMLIAIVIASIKPTSSASGVASLCFIVALLLVSTDVARGNNLAFGVGIAEVLSVTLVATVMQ